MKIVGAVKFHEWVLLSIILKRIQTVFVHEPLNAAALRSKIGIFGENHVIGFIIGTIIGFMGGSGAGSFLIGVQAGTALALFPMERTREMEAVKGRASYQENKGVGDLDPGAVTMDYQLACLSNFLMEKLDF